VSLTPNQRAVFEYILSYTDEFGHPPTHAKLMQHFGWRSPGTVQDYLSALEKKGFLSREWHTAGSVRVHEQDGYLPLLGKVAAGKPISYSKNDQKIEVPKSMLKGAGPFFVLQVSGDSMVDEGILDGDFVIIKKQVAADNGNIVVAMLEDGATIKRFFKKKTQIELHSENSKYKPILVQEGEDFRIEGVYCGLLRF
jgi:repressor LexA